MKKLIVVLLASVAVGAFAEQMSLAEARAQIGDAVANPSLVTSIVKQLAKDDQKKFIADVNEAIGKMPASNESRAASYLNVNRAAVKGARNVDVMGMLAEVFATVSPENLTVINESFANDLFSRTADPSVTFTDQQFLEIASNTVSKIAARVADVDNSAVRTGFAILMFARASNGTPANLVETLSTLLPEDVREVATKEWFPSALSTEAKSYDPILAAIDASIPNPQVVLRLAGPQTLESMLSDLAAGGSNLNYLNMDRASTFGMDRGGLGSELDNGLDRLPFFYHKKAIFSGGGTKGSDRKIAGGPKYVVDPTTGRVIVVPGGTPTDPTSGEVVGPGRVPISPITPTPPSPPEPVPYPGQW